MFGDWSGWIVQFGVTAVVILALIVLVYWLVRRYSIGGLGRIGRGRVPRLAIVDAMAVDGRRRLILVRRDNVEHLILVGGPSDVVVEGAIQRPRRPAVKPQTATGGEGEIALQSTPVAAEPAPMAQHAEPTPAPAAIDNPPIPFPRANPPQAHQPAAHQPASQQSERSFFPLRRAASAAQPARAEPLATASRYEEAIDTPAPSSQAQPELALAAEAAPMVTDHAPRTNGHDRQQVEVAPRNEPPSFANATPAVSDEAAAKVNDLEREMARLLGEITGKRPA